MEKNQVLQIKELLRHIHSISGISDAFGFTRRQCSFCGEDPEPKVYLGDVLECWDDFLRLEKAGLQRGDTRFSKEYGLFKELRRWEWPKVFSFSAKR